MECCIDVSTETFTPTKNHNPKRPMKVRYSKSLIPDSLLPIFRFQVVIPDFT